MQQEGVAKYERAGGGTYSPERQHERVLHCRF